jgi:iron(III) transport system ATP-binding protein
VSIDVSPGTFLVLLGPSGSGKTTMLRCLAGIERVSSGLITIGDRAVADGRAHVPPDERDLSMVFQDYALWPHMTAADNVGFALRRRRLGKAECRSRALTMLERVGLADFAARYPNELSGGQQQRVALARALIAEPGLILCDEPLSNLDADLRDRMRVEISGLVREAAATTVYITHDQSEAFALADQVGVLENGRLVQAGTPEEVYNSPATPFVARFTGLAGELAVRVTRRPGDGTVSVTAAGATFPVPDDGGAADADADAGAGAGAGTGTGEGAELGTGQDAGLRAGLRPGDEAVLAIRPTGVRLTSLDGETDHLSGTVADVAFRGRGYDLAIDLPGGGRLTGVFARHRPARGERIGLRLEPSGCHLFPAAGAAPAPAPVPAPVAAS